MSKKMFAEFVNQYSVSKTLRFELIPQGKTKEFIESKGLIKQDEDRAAKYKNVKKIIDEYHKDFIEQALDGLKLNDLQNYMDLYLTADKDDKAKKQFEKIKEALRKEISDAFKKHEKFKTIFAKELIRNDLLNFCRGEDKENVKEFKDFTTYFVGFHKNRENMYAADEKATTIASRLIHENLPKFIDNIKIFEKIKKDAPELTLKLNNILTGMKEIINVSSLDDIFSLDYFNETLTQRGIDLYNTVIGGRTAEEGRIKIKGLNEYINTDHNQQQADKRKRLPKFKQLYKQILSDRQSFSFLSESFQNDSDVLEAIEKFYSGELLAFTFEGRTVNVLDTIKNMVNNLETFDLSKVYFRSGTALTNVSQKIFGDWHMIDRALEDYYEKTTPIRPREKSEKFEERKVKWLKQDFDIVTLQVAIDGYENETVKEKNSGKVFAEYFAGFCGNDPADLFQKIQQNYQAVKDLLNVLPFPEEEKLGGNKEHVNRIKSFLDSIMEVMQLVRPLSLKDTDRQKDELFYSRFTPLYDQLTLTIPLYNKVRNYLTQKPYGTEKFKLNFENSTLLDGWDLNKEADNTAVILRKDNLYYLGIMDKSSNRIFRKIPPETNNGPCYEKMIYKYFPDASKMIPKCSTQLKAVVNHFKVNNSIIEIGGKNYEGNLKISKQIFDLNNTAYDNSTNTVVPTNETGKLPKLFQKGYLKITDDVDGYRNALKNWIDFCKDFLRTYKSTNQFKFNFRNSALYKSLDEFYKDIDTQTYTMNFQNVPVSFINKLVDEGKLYLFQIYNKDFSPHSKGKPNLHTLYWKMLFDEANLRNVVYKLNGQAEVFFRRKSISEKNTVVHKANESLINKNPDNPKTTSQFDYDIVKDRRYTLDKFQFHVPITLNFKSKGTLNINPTVNAFLKDNPDVNIIGIDRGERHLLYYTLINHKGEIIKQDTLNVIANEKQKVNYHDLLNRKEGDRAEARKEWGVIETIKELKEGYLSQVVHKLTDLMIENNAIIIMEDLNFGFKRGRQKVEKQVYQKFEKMLIDKLNYLVDKNKNTGEAGGLLNAFQLANRFESFQKVGKQNGLIFYVPAWNTSKIDPGTGFVDLLKPKYENITKTKEFIEKFDSIRFTGGKNYFEFSFDYKNFTEKAEGSKTKWIVCTTNEDRYVWNKTLNNNKGGQERYDATERLKALFDANQLEYKNGIDLKPQILKLDSADFFRGLMKALSVTLAIRYNNGEKGERELDYILSPVADSNGCFFDSRKADGSMPQNADANGAYNTALKGLLLLERLREHGVEAFEKSKKVDKDGKSQWLPNKEWLQFKQAKVS
jgi:CRISPR-associated protein Cpf1